jgi:hypothetical protein
MTKTHSTKTPHHVSPAHQGEKPMKTTKQTHTHASTNATRHEGEKPMKTTKQTHTATNATNHEGEKPMKTTKQTHASHASTNATSHEGETTMTATQSKTSSAATTPAATTTPPTPAPTMPTKAAGYLATCTALLKQFDAAFPQTDPLTATDKKRMTKARKGSERYTPQLVALAKEHGVNLASVPLEEIESASAEAAQLVPLQKQIERLSTRVKTRAFGAQSSAWGGSTKLYAVLKRLSKDDGEIASGLAPVEEYFNHRHPLVAKNHPKTKKGKAALAEQKETEASAAETPGATSAPATVTVTPPPPAQPAASATEPTTAPTTSNGAATNGAATNGAAHT